MLLQKLSGKNYFVALFILLGITVMLVVAVFILTAYFPESLGRQPYEYELSSVYEFEPWSFETENLNIAFPRGGIIAAVYESNRKMSILLLGDGIYNQDEQERTDESTAGIFIVIEYSLFEEIRRDNLFFPVDSRQYEETAAIAARQMGIPVIWKEMIPLTFHADSGLVYYYYIAEDGTPQLPPVSIQTVRNVAGSALIYTLFFLIILLLLTIFLLDRRISRTWVHLSKSDPGAFSLGLVVIAAALAFAGEIMPKLYGRPADYAVFAYGAAVLILVIAARYRKIDHLSFGFYPDRLRFGYFVALATALIIITATRGFPGRIALDGSETALAWLLVFLLTALPREMIWRGYIQTTLSRKLSPAMGLLITVLLIALVHFTTQVMVNPWMLDYPYTFIEAGVFVPGTAAVLGYLYLRTENILASAFLHSLLVFLPQIFFS